MSVFLLERSVLVRGEIKGSLHGSDSTTGGPEVITLEITPVGRKYGLDEWTVKWTENWLNGRAQSLPPVAQIV